MLRYAMAASTLKVFSQGTPMKKLYRTIGNIAGTKKRARNTMPSTYLERIKWKTELCRRFNILKDGDTILELGTGWVHWEALTLKLFFDIKATLYDVWDNRQLTALISYVCQLDSAFDAGFTVPGVDVGRARSIIREIKRVTSFEELYSLLNFQYVLDSRARVDSLGGNQFQLVVSAGVFEHVYKVGMEDFLANWVKLLAPGGFAMHSINISDHLSHYDKSTSPKQYLAFSESVWKCFFENDLQYINRIQRCEWLDLFDRSGLTLLDEDGSYADLKTLKVNERYAGMSMHDLQCTVLKVLLQKNSLTGR